MITDTPRQDLFDEKKFIQKKTLDILKNIISGAYFYFDMAKNTINFSGELYNIIAGEKSVIYDIDSFISGNRKIKTDVRVIKKILYCIRNNKKKTYTISVIGTNKKRYWLKIKYTFITDTQNTNIAAVGNIEDITEQINAIEYYDKALSVWFTQCDDCLAAYTVNVNTMEIIGGFSSLVAIKENSSISFNDYKSKLLPNILNKGDKKQFLNIINQKNLLQSYKNGKTHIDLELEINHQNSHNWFQVSIFLINNPKTNNIMALFKWKNLNDIKLHQKINQILLGKTYDYICLIFAKSNSYSILMNSENNKLFPDSLTSGYEELAKNMVNAYSQKDSIKYLSFCFSLSNLTNQLNLNEQYSFLGKGLYPDGTPATKLFEFRYLDKHKQIILLTRKDITNQAESFSFKQKSKIISIKLSDLVCIEGNGKNSIIYTQEQEYNASEMLSSIQERLPGKDFIRCHRCYIIRYDAILKIEKNNAFLNNNNLVPISRTKISLLKKRIQEHK